MRHLLRPYCLGGMDFQLDRAFVCRIFVDPVTVFGRAQGGELEEGQDRSTLLMQRTQTGGGAWRSEQASIEQGWSSQKSGLAVAVPGLPVTGG
jgi:hypothetical protein